MPTPDLQQRIRDAWTRGADHYDADPGHGLLTRPLENAWSLVLGETLGPERLTLLDVGAGTGFLSVMAAKLGHRVTGLDLTPAMLDRARRRAGEADLDIAWHQGDAQALPFPDAVFDGVISRHVLWTMPDPAQALREWIRVTRPGGRVIWFDAMTPPAGWRNPAWMGRLRRTLAAGLRRLSREPDHAAPHHYDRGMYDQLPLRGVTSWQPLRELLAEIGVDDPIFRRLPALGRAERAGWPRHRRLASRSRPYVGSFTVPTPRRSEPPS